MGLLVPTGQPVGINWAHPAVQNLRFAGVSMGVNFLNLGQRKFGTIAGAPTAVLDPDLGSTTNFTGATSNITFPGAFPSIVESTTTMAFSAKFSGLNTSDLLQSSTIVAGWDLHFTGGANFTLTSEGVADHQSGLFNISNAVPYFMVASASAAENVINFLVLNRSNGSFVTASTTSSTPVLGNGTVKLGPDAVGVGASVSTAMISGAFLTMPQLIAWAKVPESFLTYAPAPNLKMFSLPSGGVITRTPTLTLMGVG